MVSTNFLNIGMSNGLLPHGQTITMTKFNIKFKRSYGINLSVSQH